MELTLELSQLKWPQPTQLPKLFEDNLPAMLAFPLAGAFGGVRWAAHSILNLRFLGLMRRVRCFGSAATTDIYVPMTSSSILKSLLGSPSKMFLVTISRGCKGKQSSSSTLP